MTMEGQERRSRRSKVGGRRDNKADKPSPALQVVARVTAAAGVAREQAGVRPAVMLQQAKTCNDV